MIVLDRFLWSLSTDDRERTKNSITTVILKFSDPWNATFNGLLVIKLLFVKETTNIEYKYTCVSLLFYLEHLLHTSVLYKVIPTIPSTLYCNKHSHKSQPSLYRYECPSGDPCYFIVGARVTK